jgi:broad specificity phosphatase PhoE
MRILLVRHGQTEWNIGARAQGHTDISLDETGLRQSQLLGEAFKGEKIDVVISSDLKRSVQTAEPIAQATGAPLETDARLRERSFGDWEGQDYHLVGEQLHALTERYNLSRLDTRPPHGESMRDVWTRIDPAIQALKKDARSIVLVSHGGALALILAKFIGADIEVSRAFRFANTGVTELHSRPNGSIYIKRYNDTVHLASEEVLSGDLDGTHR